MKSALLRSPPQSIAALGCRMPGQQPGKATILPEITASMDIVQGRHHDRGRAAEATAGRLLEAAGLRVLARNFRCKLGEIDIVAETPAGLLVFVEVKVRTHTRYGGALAALSAGQRRRLIRTALAFLASRTEFAGRPCRFDLIALQDPYDGNRGAAWIPNAFAVDGS